VEGQYGTKKMDKPWSVKNRTLNVDELYALSAAERGLVVGAELCFPDMDNKDQVSQHLIGWQQEPGQKKLLDMHECARGYFL